LEFPFDCNVDLYQELYDVTKVLVFYEGCSALAEATNVLDFYDTIIIKKNDEFINRDPGAFEQWLKSLEMGLYTFGKLTTGKKLYVCSERASLYKEKLESYLDAEIIGIKMA
jgi:hypothetical protein